MGRAIDMENRIDDHDRRLKLVENALEEISRSLVNTTTTHHVDLTDDMKTKTRTVKKPMKAAKKKAKTAATT